MRYFTPDLLERYGSLDDMVANAAHDEWEAATQKYQKHFVTIQRQLPRKLRGILRRFHLHDALVCFVGVAGRVLHLTLQLDALPNETIFLRYRLVSDLKMITHAIAGHDVKEPLTWLYDEVDVAYDEVFPIIEQRILFSNGLELAIQFQDLSYSTAQTLPLIANDVVGAVQVEMAG